MFAIIRTGGKQYLVSPGQKIEVEKLTGSKSSKTTFDDILLFQPDSGQPQIGQPRLANVKVEAKVIEPEKKGQKITIIKHKPKKRYHLKKGHRQTMTLVEITNIKTS